MAGSEPVATIAYSKPIVRGSPSAGVTTTERGPSKRARPLTNSTPCCFVSWPSPPVRRLTTPCFHWRSLSRSIEGGP